MSLQKIETIFSHTMVGVTTFYFTYMIKDMFHFRDNLLNAQKIEKLQRALDKASQSPQLSQENKPTSN